MGNYHDMEVCDLRALRDAEAVRQIEGIWDVELLILPNDVPPEVTQAYAAIPKHDIENVIYLGADDKIINMNGVCEIGENTGAGCAKLVVLANGITIVSGIAEGLSVDIHANGITMIKEKLRDAGKITSVSSNGITMYADFDKYKLFSNGLTLDADMLGYLDEKMALIAGNSIEIAADVTVDMLKSKGVVMVAGNKIVCPKAIAGYVRATATVGNKIEISDGNQVSG